MADASLPFWERATGPLRREAARFPFERAILMGLAAVVGLYGGLAAGLFATAIRFVQLVVFGGAEVASSLFGSGRVAWLRLFRTRLGAAHWHLEFVALAALLLIAAAVLDAVGAKRLPMFEVHRIRAVALVAALGLSLYYPLLLLRTFNGTFRETSGGLYEMLLEAPRWTWVLGPAAGALLAALVVRLSPESGGHGVVEVIEAVHKRAPIKGRVALWKSLAAGLVIGSGGSALRPVAWSLKHPSEIAVYLLLGVVAGLCGLVYIRVIHAAEERLGRVPLRPELRAALGGLLVGFVGLLAPRVLGTGIETMNAALAGKLAFGALVLALGCKLIATSFTLGSGSPGGSFFPAVFLGAMLGGAFGDLAHSAFPGIASSPGAYAAVGMGAVVAGATLAPLTGVLMMFELTGSYQIVLPLLVACGIAAAVVQGILSGSIYTIRARRRGVQLSRGGAALSDLSVAQALDRVESLPADLPYEDLLRIVGPTHHAAFPVMEGTALAGIVSVPEARAALLDPAVDRNATARAFARPAQTLLADDDLGTAVERLSSAGVAQAGGGDHSGQPGGGG